MLRGIHKASSTWLGRGIMAVIMGGLVVSFAIWGIKLSTTQVGPAHGASRQPEAVERLRAGDLVDEVEIDVQQVGLTVGAVHDVRIPDLLRERTSHA